MEQIYPEKPEDYDVLCITGSDSAAFDDKEWIHTLADYIRFVRDTKPTKLISFCFGHQIVHHALNGIAEINPAGTEIGRVEVDLTKEAQVLLKTDKEKFGVYLGHRDHVAKLAPGFISLGSTPPTPHQGAICGNDMLTWQVHPELPAELMIGFLINQKNGTLTMNRVCRLLGVVGYVSSLPFSSSFCLCRAPTKSPPSNWMPGSTPITLRPDPASSFRLTLFGVVARLFLGFWGTF